MRAVDHKHVFQSLAQRHDARTAQFDIHLVKNIRNAVQHARAIGRREFEDILVITDRHERHAWLDREIARARGQTTQIRRPQFAGFLQALTHLRIQFRQKGVVHRHMLRQGDLKGIQRHALRAGINGRVKNRVPALLNHGTNASEQVRLVRGIDHQLHAVVHIVQYIMLRCDQHSLIRWQRLRLL